MSYETIQTEIREGVCVVTLNRPERLNAWIPQMGLEMSQAIEDANNDDDIVAIVMTGAGRGFCAGADFEAVLKSQADGEADHHDSGGVLDWIPLIRRSKPVVAAINGPAVGMGLTLILVMDYLVASTSAKLSMPFVKLGMVPELASSHFLTSRVGFGKGSELMLTGRTVNAAEALDLGLVDEVTEPDALLSTAIGLAKSMGENPLSAVREIKKLITLNACETDFRQVLQREGKAMTICTANPEHKEAIAAFMEKREPDFKSARERK